ncbi:hypothetical protein [Gorillibacterium massiliense]|uniref:glycoside hydrolase family 78 protein n=1 Tax=Gorillibacterium massiliense TaxID=1280390 RepID=UPI0012DCC2AC|nr:hypothetical protein [Gorillibacterium massiliense]
MNDTNYYHPWSAPGAAALIYYYAFTVDVTSHTYKYPYNVTVEYEPSKESPSPSPSPGSKIISGDFDILPGDTINYRDPFQLQPKNVVVSGEGCTFKSVTFRLINGVSWTSSPIASKTQKLSFTYSNYPPPVSIGSVTVQMQVQATCGNSDWITKTLNVNGPKGNQPPFAKIGFFYDGDNSSVVPLYQAVEGARLEVRLIRDNTSTPMSPSDPDGDPVDITGWDFDSSTSWVRDIPDKGRYSGSIIGYTSLDATESGAHTVSAVFSDPYGATYTAHTSINIVPPNPIPVAQCIEQIKENRDVPANGINADKSYSPLARTINHALDVWTNKLSRYFNGTDHDVKATVTLEKVTDSAGLESLGSSSCSITVHPDLPPKAALAVPSIGIRNQKIHIENRSYSPDGDTISTMEYKFKYDANNNGFADDTWSSLPGDLSGFDFNPSKVGKILFYAKATEDYGKWDDTLDEPEKAYTLDIVNDAPEVSFEMEGKNQQPDLNLPLTYTADMMLKWPLYDVNTTKVVTNKSFWMNGGDGRLSAGLGKGMERQTQYSKSHYVGSNSPYYSYSFLTAYGDDGFGPNNITPYKAMAVRDDSRSQPILIPYAGGKPVTDPNASYDRLSPVKFGSMVRTNKKYMYFDADNFIWGFNKNRVPTYTSSDHVDWTPGSSYVSMYLEHKWANGVNPYDFAIPINEEVTKQSSNGSTYTELQIPSTPAMTKQIPLYSDYSAYMYHLPPISTLTVSPQGSAVGYEVAGDVVYVLYKYSTYEYAYKYSSTDIDGHTHEGTDYVSSSMSLGVWTYDAYTGALLGTTDMTKKTDTSVNLNYSYGDYKLFTKNDHLIVIQNSAPTINFAEFDRTADLVKTGSINLAPNPGGTFSRQYTDALGRHITDAAQYYAATWSTNGSMFWKDDQGNLYTYAKLTLTGTVSANTLNQYDNPEAPTGNYLIKINSDLSGYTLLARTGGDVTSYGSLYPFHEPEENDPIMAINPTANVAYTRTFRTYYNGGYGSSLLEFYDTIDLTTGAVSSGSPIQEWAKNLSSPFHINADGSRVNGWGSSSASGTFDMFNWHQRQIVIKNASSYTYDAHNTTDLTYGQYVGDGMFLSFYSGDYVASGPGYSQGYPTYDQWMFLDVGSFNPTEAYKGFILGQFVSEESQGDAQFTYNMKMNHPTEDSNLAGFSFRMQNPMNRYAVESDGQTLYLSRYVNGVRTVLKSVGYPFSAGSEYSFKIKALGSEINVWMNGIPVFSGIQDTTYTEGKFGYFTDKSFVSFSALSAKMLTDNTQWMKQYAIWEEGSATADIRYKNITFTDPENDPMAGSFEWTYQHTPRFLNNQGVSSLNGKTFASEQMTFDKVGDYRVTLKARDDPYPESKYKYPDNTFDSYRKSSNAFYQDITVHRRPVAQFTLSFNADNSVKTTDESYDPDRWLSPTNYSTEATGIDYKTTRGILDRRFITTSPDGTSQYGRLSRPDQVGTYTVSESVVDEYGAWSEWYSQSIEITTIVPNHPPTATLTYPAGTSSNPTYVSTLRPTIRWNQQDPDLDTIFAAYQVVVKDESGAVKVDSGIQGQDTSANMQQWSLDKNLQAGKKYQVQVRVSDGGMWSDWSNIGWMLINRPPTATMLTPNGTVSAPSMLDVLQPLFKWSQMDPDPDTTFTYFQLQVSDETNTILLDSGQFWQGTTSAVGSWKASKNLTPNEKLQVRVRVFDGFAWSDWSPQTWFVINRPPVADFTWNPAIPWEGDDIQLINQTTDPDGNLQDAQYEWRIEGPAYPTPAIFSTTDVFQPGSVTDGYPGTYKVTLTATDRYQATSTVTKTITVGALGITGEVSHTPEWKKNLNEYNTAHPDNPRSDSVFWAGEAFALTGTPTDTGLNGPVAIRINVQAAGIGSLPLMKTSGLPWKGVLDSSEASKDLELLEDGVYPFVFTVTYTNGVQKQATVPVTIAGNWMDYFRLHRRF